MKQKITLLILSIAIILASVSSALAYSLMKVYGTHGEIVKWKGENPEVSFRINMSGHSVHSSVSESDALNEIIKAMATWSNVPTASLKLTYAGTSNLGFGWDGTNNISWHDLGNCGVAALNSSTYTLDGEMIESEILFNSYYPYHINGTQYALDLQNVAVHELGHSVPLGDLHGLEHIDKTMLGVIGWGETKKRDLHQDDIDGISFLYPKVAQPECTYSLSHTNKEFGAVGGNDNITITAPSGCSWSAQGNPGWITINSSSSGSQSGAISYSVAGNSSTSQRVATMSIAGKTFTVNQASGCTYTITPNSASPSATGGSLSVSVTPSNSACTWTSTSNAAWITVTAGASGTGNGTVSLSVAANTGIARTGTVTIAGQTFTVNQASPTSTGISASVSSVNFGNVVLLKPTSRAFTITNKSNATVGITLSRAGKNVSEFTTTITSRNILPGASATITVTFKPAAKGDRSATLKVTPSNLPSVSIPLTGKGI